MSVARPSAPPQTGSHYRRAYLGWNFLAGFSQFARLIGDTTIMSTNCIIPPSHPECPVSPLPKLKNDRYRKVRGGSAELLTLYCAKCSVFVLLYQKDGPGKLIRCYLNRIFAPSSLEALQHDRRFQQPSDVPALKCSHCSNLIGVPMRYDDGRLAYRLVPGSFYKRKAAGS